MVRGSVRPTILALALAAAAAPPAHAQERTLDQELAQARALMKDEKWEPAAAVLKRVFATRVESPEVLDRLADIEEDLKLCLFRAKATAPTAQELFGPCAKSLARMGRRLVMEFPEGPTAPSWQGKPGEVLVLPIRFEGEISMEFDSLPLGPGNEGILAILHYDPDRESGYAVVPGFRYSTETHRYWLDSTISRMDGKDDRQLQKGEGPSIAGTNELRGYRVSVKDGATELVAGPARGGTGRAVAAAAGGRLVSRDGKYRSGLVALKAYRARDLVVSGTLEEMSYRALVSGHYTAKYKEWAAKNYRRAEVLPAWALKTAKSGARANAAAVLVPADAASPLDPATEKALLAWRDGRTRAFFHALQEIADPSPGLDLYLAGLAALGTGGAGSAEAHFDDLVRKFPAFGPGFLYRAVARYRRRDLEGAKRDLEMAWEESRSLPDLYMLAAHIALGEGDLAKAQEHCAEARRRGAVHRDLESLAEWVRRSLRGPMFVKRYEQRTPAAVIATDHSQELCRDTGLNISVALAACVAEFPDRRPATAPVRVHVFSSREGFLEYARDLERDLHGAAGAFIPSMNEMVLFLPDVQREALWRTVRHETFHAFVHGFADEVPVWFDEGFAQWFENAKGPGGSLTFGGVEADAVRTLRDAGDRGLTPLKALFLMDTETFRGKVALHYAQSQALVRFMNGREPWRALTREYFRSVVAGLSREEAYAKHLEPRIAGLDREFRTWLQGIVAELGDR